MTVCSRCKTIDMTTINDLCRECAEEEAFDINEDDGYDEMPDSTYDDDVGRF